MISLEEIKQLSRLCRIKFSEDEVGDLMSKLNNVIGLIKQLENVDTEGVEPLTSVVASKLYTREDKVTDGGIEDDLFINVPGKSANLAREIKCFIVPKVVE
jgi:aspartyl-tRNA(Asn)/glutamyl-tRNA(Gln) amidotransferase subunit C